MKGFKKIAAVISIVGVLGISGAAFAATVMTPAQIVSGLTGKSVTEVNQERSAGKTYGTIANDAGKLDEFKTQMLEQKKAILDQRVEAGNLTKNQADQIYNSIKDHQTTCNGTGSARMGRRAGAGFGQGCGMALGQGAGSRNW